VSKGSWEESQEATISGRLAVDRLGGLQGGIGPSGRLAVVDRPPAGVSMAGRQREVRGQSLWTPVDTLADGGDGVGVGAFVRSRKLEFSGWEVSLAAGTANAKINVDKTFVGSSVAATDVIWVRFYVPSWAAGMEATLYLSSVTNWSKFAFGGWSMNQLQEGWNELPMLASSMSLSGGEVFPMVPQKARMQVKNTCGAGGSIYIGDDIRVATGMPMLTLCFDDGYTDLVRYAYPILSRNGLRASVFVVSDWQNQQASGAMADNTVASWEDLRELDSQGWDISPHTTGHQNALSFAEVGTIAAAGTVATFAGVGVSGDNTVNFVSGGTLVFDKPRGLSIWSSANDTGKACVVTGIVGGLPIVETVQMRNATFTCTATEWDVVTSVVMGAAAAGTVTLRAAYNARDYRDIAERSRDAVVANGMPRAASWFAWPRGEFSAPLRRQLLSAGFRIRGTAETQTGNILGGGLARDFPSYSAGGSRTLGDVQAFVQTVEDRCAISSLFWHHVNPTPMPINVLPATLISEIEWLVGEVYASRLRCPTFSQLERSWV
jgi:peptidoglycan/xylan/chitin deacetylase (PgdA/CDA1 family)